MIITQLREYLKDSTISELFVNGDLQPGMILEDIGRTNGVKIQDETCIPEGVYRVTITPSARFGKDMLLLFNRPDYSVQNDGIKFTGIRVHRGANTSHTAGCLLYSGYEALQARVAAELAAGREVLWVITRGLK